MDRRSVFGLLATMLAPSIATATTRGRFLGRLRLDVSTAGPGMTLIEPFGYVDAMGLSWSVKAGARINGASIPQPFWSITGGPFDGPYLRASVVHDWYCDLRVRPWQHVHRMFYDAMLDSGVNRLQAKVMYLAVLGGGPRWNQQAIDNARLAMKSGLTTECFVGPDGVTRCAPPAMIAEPQNYPPLLTDPSELQKLAAAIAKDNLSLEQIERMFPARTIEELPAGTVVYQPRPELDPNPPV